VSYCESIYIDYLVGVGWVEFFGLVRFNARIEDDVIRGKIC
jgi:hypothetical protein